MTNLFGKTVKLETQQYSKVYVNGQWTSLYLDCKDLEDMGANIDPSPSSNIFSKLWRKLFPYSGAMIEKEHVDSVSVDYYL